MNKLTIFEKKDDALDTVIEKHGLTRKFTTRSVLNHLDATRRTLKNNEVQLMANNAQDEISLNLIPMLADLPKDKMEIVQAYASRQLEKPVIEALITACKEVIEEYEPQLEEFKKFLNIKVIEQEIKDPVPSPLTDEIREKNG